MNEESTEAPEINIEEEIEDAKFRREEETKKWEKLTKRVKERKQVEKLLDELAGTHSSKAKAIAIAADKTVAKLEEVTKEGKSLDELRKAPAPSDEKESHRALREKILSVSLSDDDSVISISKEAIENFKHKHGIGGSFFDEQLKQTKKFDRDLEIHNKEQTSEKEKTPA